MLRLCGPEYQSSVGEHLCRLLSYQIRNGQVCLDLDELNCRKLWPLDPQEKNQQKEGHRLLYSAELKTWLSSASIVSKERDIDKQIRPLVWDEEASKLFLYRHYDYELRLVRLLKKLCLRGTRNIQQELLSQSSSFSQVDANQELDQQQLAVYLSVLQPFLMISGGPGTGKTHTIVKILQAHLELEPKLRFALAAPTGKAAMRIGQSINQQNLGLEMTQEAQVSTLQRLLGQSRDGSRFYHNPKHPLDLDLLIIDEASMIDLALFVHTLEALGPQTCLILLGDHHQLASVASGAVFRELCRNPPSLSKQVATKIKDLFGLDAFKLVSSCEDNSQTFLQDSLVVLEKNFRFTENSSISILSKQIRQKNIRQALVFLDSLTSQLTAGTGDRNFFYQEKDIYSQAFTDLIMEGFGQLREDSNIESMLRVVQNFCVLAPLRQGKQGVAALNTHVVRILLQANLLKIKNGKPTIYPILISENDYQLDLFNGDVGLVIQTPEKQSAYFYGFVPDRVKSSEGQQVLGLREIPLQILPHHEMSFAMTVHKSQGSEFTSVVLVLPESKHPLVNRELIYTALTRARQKISVFTSKEVLQAALTNFSERSSGLRDRLVQSISE